MIPGMNPRMMRQAMKRMGIQQDDMDVSQVIFVMSNKRLVFDNPSVAKVNMMGSETFQVTGDFHEESLDSSVEITQEDIETVMSQTGCSKEDAESAIKETNGDLAEAILKLSE